MLTAHEFATLLHRAPEQLQIDREDVFALVEQHLIVMQHDDASGERRPALTADGLSVVQCVQRNDARGDVTDA